MAFGCRADAGVQGAKRQVNFSLTCPLEALAHTASALGPVTIIAENGWSGPWNHLVNLYNSAPCLSSLYETHLPILTPI